MAVSSFQRGHTYPVTEVSGFVNFHQGDVLNFYQPVCSQEQVCHQLFKTSDYESHKLPILEAAPGTCRWVLEHPEFLKWQEDDYSKVLWISAYPGCGKSVLVKLLTDTHLLLQKHLAICYFFFRRGCQEQENLHTALCAILHQLFSSQPHLLHHAVLEWQKSGPKIHQEISVLWRILQKALADPAASQVACVIDALDECGVEEREVLINLIGKQLSGQNGARVKLTFLLTSRPCHEIEHLLEKVIPSQSLIRIQGESENGQLRNEIHLVIRQQVKNLAQRYELTVNHKRRLLSQLLRMEQRTYLWWSLAFGKICEAYEGSLDPEQVRIDDFSVSIENEYERILDSIDPKLWVHAKLILSVMVAARRPLTILEMALAMEVTRTLRNGRQIATHVDAQQLMRQIQKWCGFLVLVHKKRLYFIHDTVRDFMLNSSRQSDAKVHRVGEWRHSISLAFAHRTLSVVCQVIIRRNRAFAQSSFISQKSATLVCPHHGRNTLLSYANVFGVYHAAEAIRHLDVYRGVFFVHRLFSFGMDLQTMDERGKSLLHRMTDFDAPEIDVSVIVSILNRGGLVQTADQDEGNCLQYAVLKSQAALADLLIQSGFMIDGAAERKGQTRCADRVTAGRRLSKRHDAIVDLGLTTLHTAITFCDLWGVKYLVQKGADVHVTDSDGHTALHIAALPCWKQLNFGYNLYRWKNKADWIRDLDYSAPASKIRWQTKARSAIVSYLCETSPSLVDVLDNDRLTALDLASEICQYGSEVVSVLLQKGANPKIPDGDGVTAVHRIARRGPICLLQMLFSSRSLEIGLVDRFGRNILHFAAMGRNEPAIRYIIGRIETMKLCAIEDRRGQNALQASLFTEEFYTSKPLLGVMQILSEAGVAADHQNHEGQDALAHYIVRNKAVIEAEVVDFLLIRGCDPFFEDSGRLNLAHHLVYSRIEQSISPLIVLQKWGTDLRARDSKGRTVLHHAAVAGTITVELLNHLKYCLHVDFDAEDTYSKTALDYVNEIMRDKLSPSYMNSNCKLSTSPKVSAKIARAWIQSYNYLQSLPESRRECCCDSILLESCNDTSVIYEALFGDGF